MACTKTHKKTMIGMAVQSILQEQDKNGGKTPPGFMSKMLQDLHQVHGIQGITRDVLKCRVQRFKEKQKKQQQQEEEEKQQQQQQASTASMMNHPHHHDDDKENEDACHGGGRTTSANGGTTTTTGTVTSRRPRGRPVGSTKLAKFELLAKKKKWMNEVTVAYATKLREAKANGKNSRLPKGSLAKLVNQKRLELGLPLDNSTVKINLNAIRSRLSTKSKSLTSWHPGTPSPLQELEMLILPIVIQRAKIKQPMKAPEFIELINTRIEGTIHQTKLMEWKKIHEPQQTGDNLGKVGVGYFTRFMKRYAHHFIMNSKKHAGKQGMP